MTHPWDEWYLSTYIYQKNQLNAGKYTSPMDGMGVVFPVFLGGVIVLVRWSSN